MFEFNANLKKCEKSKKAKEAKEDPDNKEKTGNQKTRNKTDKDAYFILNERDMGKSIDKND